MVRVVKEFRGCREGERKVRLFRVGEELTGSIARVAVGEGWAVDESTQKVRRTTAHSGAPKKRGRPRKTKADDE